MVYKEIPEEFENDFFIMWRNDFSPHSFYDFAKKINPDILFGEFIHGWNWFPILDNDYDEAKVEFCKILSRMLEN